MAEGFSEKGESTMELELDELLEQAFPRRAPVSKPPPASTAGHRAQSARPERPPLNAGPRASEPERNGYGSGATSGVPAPTASVSASASPDHAPPTNGATPPRATANGTAGNGAAGNGAAGNGAAGNGAAGPPPLRAPVQPVPALHLEDGVATPPAPRPGSQQPEVSDAERQLKQVASQRAATRAGHAADDGSASEPPEYLVALVTRYQRELGETTDERKALRLHFEVARLLEHPIGDLRRAAAHYQEVVRRAPEHGPAIRGARRVLLRKKSYGAAYPLYEAEIRLTSDPRDKASLHYARGRLLEDALGDTEGAREAYEIAFGLNRTDGRYIKAIEQIHERKTQNSPFDADGILRLYEQSPHLWAADPVRHTLHLTHQGRLQERAGDVDGAVASLKAALRSSPRAVTTAALLHRILEAHGRWRDLVELLTHQAELQPEPPDAEGLWYRIGQLHLQKLGNWRNALPAFEHAHKLNPDNTLALRELTQLYESAEQWDDLVVVLGRLQALVADQDEQRSLLCRMGRVQATRLDNQEGAIAAYETVLALDPQDPTALQALGKLYRDTGASKPLLDMILREAEAQEDPGRRSLAYTQAAELFERELQDLNSAIDHYSRALGLDPKNETSFHALARLLRATSRFRELTELYSREVAAHEATTPARAIMYLMKSGAVYEDQLKEPAQALQCYRRALKLDANHLGALHSLQRVAEQAGRYRELVDALELEAEKEREPTRLTSILYRAGFTLFERLGDESGALRQFQKVLAIDRSHASTLRTLAELFHRLGRHEDLLDCYRRQLPLCSTNDETAELYHRMGELSERRLGRTDSALGFYRKALELVPRHPASFRRVEVHFTRAGSFSELADLWESALNRSETPDDRARAAFRLGEVHEGYLENLERALGYYRMAAEVPGLERAAQDAIERILGKQGRFKDVLQALENENPSPEDTDDPRPPNAARELYLGELWANQVGNIKEAIAHYEQALGQPATELEALDSLEPLYRQTGAWSALARVYRREADASASAEGKVFALQELARLQERFGATVGGDPLLTYLRIFEILPHDYATLDAAERLALARGDTTTLQKLNDAREKAHHDAISQATQLTRTGEYLESVGRLNDSLEAFQRALEVDPENLGAVRGIGRVAEGSSDPNLLAEAARLEASVAFDGEDAARLLTRSAVLRSERLNDRVGAVRDLERALEIDPDHKGAATELTRNLQTLGDDARLADLLSRAASNATVDRSVELWSQVADLYARTLGNLPGAISCLHRVLRVTPDHVPTLARLATLFSEDNQWTEACNLWSRIVQLSPERMQLRDAHMALAHLWTHRLGDSSRALVSLQAALALEPGHVPALRNLTELFMQEGRTRDAERVASRYVEATTDARKRADALLFYARILGALERQNDAYLALLEATSLGGAGHDAASAIKSQAKKPGDWKDYRNALHQFLTRYGVDATEIRDTCLEKANVEGTMLGDAVTAVQTLRDGLQTLPGDLMLRAALSKRLRKLGQLADALRESRSLVLSAVAAPESWRELARNFDAVGNPEAARISLMPLGALGNANDQELHRISTPEPSTRTMPDGALAPGWFTRLEGKGDGEDVAEALLAALTPAVPKLLGRSLEPYGLSSRDRITSRKRIPVKDLADHLASVLGVASYELYLHRIGGRGVMLELTATPSILIPEAVANAPKAEQIFLLSRPFCLIAGGVSGLAQLTPMEIELLLASATRASHPGFGQGLTNDELLDAQSKKLMRAIPRRDRKRVEQLCQLYAAMPRIDFPSWCRAIHFRATKAAAVFANDLSVATRSLRDRPSQAPGSQTLTPDLQQILEFWIKDEAFALRKAVGLGSADALHRK